MNKVTFRIERCKGCRLCVEACPKHIIGIDETTINQKGFHPAYITNQEECLACAMCAMMCPDCVITVEKDS